jgi:hypothetical protein
MRGGFSHRLKQTLVKDVAMSCSPLPRRSRANFVRFSNPNSKTREFESIGKLVEDLIPTFKRAEERQFYKRVVRAYRAAARDASKIAS